MADIFPESREEEILVSMIDGEEYNKTPESRIEALLLELKEVIEEGGGGGGTTNYNLLQNKPSINSVTLTGNKSLEDLSIPTAADLAGKQDTLPVTASGNDVAFNGDIIDGQGNTLSVLAEALTKTASGNPVLITDAAGGKARSLKTTINAIQDLHGYDKPWAGGAYKNKLPVNISTTTQNGVTYTPNSDGTILTTGNATATSFIEVPIPNSLRGISITLNGCPSNGGYGKYRIIAFSNGAEVQGGIDDGEGCTFTLAADSTNNKLRILVYTGYGNNLLFKPMIRLSTETDASFAPYSNICPISGRDSVVVDDSNNLFDEVYDNLDTTVRYKSIQVGNGSFTMTTEAGGGSSFALLFFLAGNVSSGANSANNGVYSGQSRTVTAVDGYVTVAYRKGDLETQTPVGKLTTVVRSGETYTTATVTIQLGQTVYGADINWDTGVATLINKKVKGNTITFIDNTVTEGQRFRSQNVISDAKTNQITSTSLKCSEFDTNTAALSFGNFDGICIHTNGYLYVRSLTTADLTAFNALIADADICYELATPQTIQLTPEQLEMLKGYNRVTIDNGSIELGYIAKAISGNDEEIAPLVGDKATKAYAVNDFIERNDGLYRVTAPIASGASFTANNTVKMSIGEALTYLYNK